MLSGIDVFAGDIEQGTISVGASSNLLFGHTDSSDGFTTNSLCFSSEIAYFVAKNWEIGAQLGMRFSDYDDGDSQSYFLRPFMGYHWVLNETSNIYARAGGGWDISESSHDYGAGANSDSDSDQSSIFGQVGYEFFLTKNITIDFAVTAERCWSNYEHNNNYQDFSYYEMSSRDDLITSELKFKIYF